jgi:hypothetical protein
MAFEYVNAWIEVDQDEPTGTGYSDPSSCFQRLIDKNVYQSVDLLFICFIAIVPTTTSGVTYDVAGFTLQYDPTPKHPGGLSDIDYVRMVKRDARKNNPKIRFLAMLNPTIANGISQIFEGATSQKEMETPATDFAKNVVAFLKENDFHGFEIDWESPISDSDSTTQKQLEALARGLKGQFKLKDDYLFVMNTATTESLTGDIINNNVDFLTLQLYAGITKDEFLALKIDEAKLAYGATFEAFPDRQQTPEEAYKGATEGGYTIVTQWRLNSGNFEQEQDGQVTLYALCKDLGLYIANYGPTLLAKLVRPQGKDLKDLQVPVGPKSFATVNARDVTGALPWHIMNSPTITAATVISLPAIAAFDPNVLTAVVYPYLTPVASPAG